MNARFLLGVGVGLFSVAAIAAPVITSFSPGYGSSTDPQVEIHDPSVITQVYRISQEAIINAIKHGQPKSIVVTLRPDSDRFSLTIADDGCGFPAKPRPGKGMGLNIMDYRARIIGGTLKITPRPQGGTVVTCFFPNNDVHDRNSTAEDS